MSTSFCSSEARITGPEMALHWTSDLGLLPSSLVARFPWLQVRLFVSTKNFRAVRSALSFREKFGLRAVKRAKLRSNGSTSAGELHKGLFDICIMFT